MVGRATCSALPVILEKGYEAVTVQDIIGRANGGRSRSSPEVILQGVGIGAANPW
jgi:hypothetical protein